MTDEMITRDAFITDGDMEILHRVDEIIAEALEDKDPTIISSYGRGITRNVRMVGIALAKLLYLTRKNWDAFRLGGIEDDFYSVMEAEGVCDAATARKYADMFEGVFENPDVPDSVKKLLLGKPMRSLLLLPAAARDGILDWDEVVDATSVSEVRNVVRRARGEVTSSTSALIISLDIRTGQLAVRKGNEFAVPFGIINMELVHSNDIVHRAVDRIVQGTGIQEK